MHCDRWQTYHVSGSELNIKTGKGGKEGWREGRKEIGGEWENRMKKNKT